MVLLAERCDRLSGALVCLMAVFSPWAFGTTTPWAVQAMNVAGGLLGLLLAVKLVIRGVWGYRPARWDAAPDTGLPGMMAARWLTRLLAALTCLILAYTAISAWNARSTYDPDTGTFLLHDHCPWLPHSYDGGRTWRYFWNYLALALTFWAARDWLLGKTPNDLLAARKGRDSAFPGVRVPQRLRLLLWVLSLNGALIAGEALVQRLSGTEKLLWLVRPRLNAMAEAQLGPFNYRSNGAQYLNLIWPVSLGLWWRLRRTARLLYAHRGWLARHKHHLLLPCVLLMAGTAVLSLSRGGALVALLNMLAATAVLWAGWWHRSVWPRLGVLLFFGTAVGLGVLVSGAKLAERLEAADEGLLQREQMFDTARAIARDFPLFGTGPGTLDPVFQLYRRSPDEYWPAQLHNDWLETRVTFGWLGSGLIALAFLAVLARYFLPGGVPTGWRLVLLYWVALGGCLLHARWDFPLQVYSILFLFLLHCAALTVLSRRTAVT